MASRIPFDASRKHLLLIAGASGSGKSTFIQEFLNGTLAPEIRAALPIDAHSWSHAFGRRRLLWRRRKDGEKARGQILHQEITEPYRHNQLSGDAQSPGRICEVHQSPQFLKRVATVEKIYVVIVRPSRETLIRQLTERTAVLHFPVIARSKAARFAPQIRKLERALPAWMTANAARFLGRTWAHRARIRSMNDRLCALYAEPDAVDSLYKHWEASLLDLCGAKIAAPLIYVEPASAAGGGKAFQLAKPTTDITMSAPRRYARGSGSINASL